MPSGFRPYLFFTQPDPQQTHIHVEDLQGIKAAVKAGQNNQYTIPAGTGLHFQLDEKLPE